MSKGIHKRRRRKKHKVKETQPTVRSYLIDIRDSLNEASDLITNLLITERGFK